MDRCENPDEGCGAQDHDHRGDSVGERTERAIGDRIERHHARRLADLADQLKSYTYANLSLRTIA